MLSLREEELIRLSQSGDWNAFEVLLERYRTLLSRTAFLTTRDGDTAQDVLQEALVHVWRDLPSYRPHGRPHGSFKAWMLKILLNKARKHYRRRLVETVALEEAIEAPENSDGPEKTMEREEEAHRLRLAIECLSSNHREALVLRYYNDLTVPEIAKVLGCREGTIKSRLSRASSCLEQILSDGEFRGREGAA